MSGLIHIHDLYWADNHLVIHSHISSAVLCIWIYHAYYAPRRCPLRTHAVFCVHAYAYSSKRIHLENKMISPNNRTPCWRVFAVSFHGSVYERSILDLTFRFFIYSGECDNSGVDMAVRTTCKHIFALLKSHVQNCVWWHEVSWINVNIYALWTSFSPIFTTCWNP